MKAKTILEKLGDLSHYHPEVQKLARCLDHETSFAPSNPICEESIFHHNQSDISDSDDGYMCENRTRWILDYVQGVIDLHSK